MDNFAQRLLTWHDQHGRKDLPWQQDITPYRVWLSEIMLQQTQVATVIDYFNRFVKRFPTVRDLARADLDQVLHLWTGLGYYARARNLHKAAVTVVATYDGHFPESQDELEALPGIGRSTAAAIRAIAMQQHATILDGNVKRVLARYHAQAGYPGVTAVAKRLWRYAESHTPEQRTNTYTQAIMDLGATICLRSKPACKRCPVSAGCEAYRDRTTDIYPARKPKKEKPIREARFFVVTQHSGATLLEQKPSDGIWGGLWTPPERPITLRPESFILTLGYSPEQIESTRIAPRFRHTFSHFFLDIEPVYIKTTGYPALVREVSEQRWVFPEHLSSGNERIGLSAPAVKLLASLKPTFVKHA